MKIVIKFPTRSRPKKFMNVFTGYQELLSGKHEVEFLVSMDTDDLSMNNDNIKLWLNKFSNTKYYYGNSKTKIQAINADLDKLPNDYFVLIQVSDDMLPQVKNYDDIIVNKMLENFPDGDGVLHFSDGRVGESLNTLVICGKKYYDRFNYIYHPSYISVFVDNEFDEVSKILGRKAYINQCLFVHGWINYVGFDELMKRNENPITYGLDKKNYFLRKARNFDLKI